MPSLQHSHKSFAHLVIFRERLAVGFEPHKIKLARLGAVDAAIDPGHQQVAIRGGFDNRKASGVFDFIQCSRRCETTFAIIHREADIGASFVAFFAGNRPDDVRSFVGAERDFGTVFFPLDGFDGAVYPPR